MLSILILRKWVPVLLYWMSFFCHVSVILIVVSVCTATGAWNWLIDPDTQKVCTHLLSHQKYWGTSTSLPETRRFLWATVTHIFTKSGEQVILLVFIYLCFAGLFLFIIMESSLLHHQLYHSHSSLFCWDTQTSCGTINVSFVAVRSVVCSVNDGVKHSDSATDSGKTFLKCYTFPIKACGLHLWLLLLQYCCPLSDSFSRIQHVLWWCECANLCYVRH